MPDGSLVEAPDMWGGADYEQIAQLFAPIHDALISRLAPRPGERWLDVATGTGEVALRAARAGAETTGLDVSPGLLARARAKSEAEGLRIQWDLASAETMPYEDAAFDVVSSCFGVIFAPNQGAAARELGRVCRPGGRLGLTTWRPGFGCHALYARFSGETAPSGADEWGEEARLEALLGAFFDYTVDEDAWHLRGESPQAVWELMTGGAPPLKALVESLEPERGEEFKAAMLEYWEGFRTDGGVAEPRPFLIVTGRRR